jgi:hypothetical protein
MGKYLDILRARRSGAYDINDINDKIPAAPQGPAYDINDINDKIPVFGRLNRLCRTSSALADAFATLERRCPNAIPVDRWQMAVEDARGFLWQWAEQSEALGWTPDDLFGLHPTAPLARYDAMGLVWLLRGTKVVAITATAATIRTATGGTLTFYRKPRRARDA